MIKYFVSKKVLSKFIGHNIKNFLIEKGQISTDLPFQIRSSDKLVLTCSRENLSTTTDFILDFKGFYVYPEKNGELKIQNLNLSIEERLNYNVSIVNNNSYPIVKITIGYDKYFDKEKQEIEYIGGIIFHLGSYDHWVIGHDLAPNSYVISYNNKYAMEEILNGSDRIELVE